MSLPGTTTLLVILVALFAFCAAEVLVQLNVNRPLNDVSDKFVSFVIKPEDLYKALDGPNRKTVTRVANMLGDSYIKFSGDYHFASNGEARLRNPTKIIWKGFNRWSRAVNWTMIIPVPYTPHSWDPMHALRILNSSYFMGISDCIWQLGTDFSSSRAQDYVTELKTLDLMVDTFKPYVSDWQIMGADISAGSSATETARYVDLSKDLNTAYGWMQSAEPSSNSITSYIHDNDPALKTLLSKRVPVWLNLSAKPKSRRTKHISNRLSGDDVNDALRWAITLGDAASSGFNAVFKRIDLAELERPNLSFYVTTLFKKVMGTRVFPARPLNIFLRSNKLYTHCANAVSGGIAFMLVNPHEDPIQIAIRSLSKIEDTEYWQYILTFKKGYAYLNNERLSLNSTLTPKIKSKSSSNRLVQLSAPGKSVGFWVLPTVNLEHCQYTEIEAGELDSASKEDKVIQKRYSSSDLLLRKLIQESSLTKRALARAIHRGRRYATFADRRKRFVLEDKPERTPNFGKFFESFNFDDMSTKKPDNDVHDKRAAAMNWFKDLLEGALKEHDNAGTHKRNARSTDGFLTPLFAGVKGTKKPTFVKKIIEIRKPEKKGLKPAFNPDNFDEEEFFSKMGAHSEPEVPRVPDGDVHLRHITNLEGEDEDDFREERHKRKSRKSQRMETKESVSEMKPLRLLPTEFYEAMPSSNFGLHKTKYSNNFNTLLFPEPFSKKSLKKNKNRKSISPPKKSDEDEDATEGEVEAIGGGNYQSSGQLAADFLRAQEELARAFLRESAKESEEKKSEDESKKESGEKSKETADADAETDTDAEGDVDDKFKALRSKYIDYLAENLDNFFSETPEAEDKDEKPKADGKNMPWWDLSTLRKRRSTRALHYQLPDEAWLSNTITKEDDSMPANSIFPEDLDNYEQQVEAIGKANKVHKESNVPTEKTNDLVVAVRERLNKFVKIVTRQLSKLYNKLTRPMENAGHNEMTTNGNNLN